MKLWCHATNTPMDQVLGFAQSLDEMGFEGIALTHHLVDLHVADADHPYRKSDEDAWWDSSDTSDPATPDPWVTAAAIANVTTKLLVGSSILVLPMQDPFTVAKAVTTAAHFSQGRVVLGVGAGWMQDEFDLVGADFATRGARMDEMLEVMRSLFSGEDASYDGRFYRFDKLRMAPPYWADLPIYVGGESPRALKRAAKFDGWFAAGPYDVPTAIERCSAMRTAREEAGTLNRAFECVVPLMEVPTKGEWESMAEVGATAAMFVPARRPELGIRTLADRCAFAERIAAATSDYH